MVGLRRAFNNALAAGGGGGTMATLCHPADPSGTLLREDPYEDRWVSYVPVPNGAKVRILKSVEGFTLVQHGGDGDGEQTGWVRTAYVTVDGAAACAQPPAAPAAAPAAAFKVTTYNILTGGDSNEHYWQKGKLSPFESDTTGLPHALWNHRRDLVVAALRGQGDDIVMLNECTAAQLRYIEGKMPHMQRAHYTLKVGEVDGSAILIKKEMWKAP